MNPQSASATDRLDYASLSDVGLRRSNNQDSFAVMVAGSNASWLQLGDLFMVADGMGAHAAGELASKLSTDTIPLVYHKLTDRNPAEALRMAVEEANAQIHGRGQASSDFKGMGTTTTVLVLLKQGALLGHVGDSRAYRLRANRYEQLTFDHSLVWEMRAAGQIQGQVPDYVPKNVITRSLGPNAAVQVDLEGPHGIQAGDTFLICSDGLSGQIKDDEMGMILNCMPPAEAVRALVDLANLRGGPDNITVVIVRAVGSEWSSPGGEGVRETPRRTRPVPPVVWILAGVAALAGLGLLAINFLAAAVAIMAAVALATGGMMYRQSGDEPTVKLDGQRLGRGPYTAVNCIPNAEFTRHLSETVRDLREAANQGDLEIDWNRFNGFLDRAAAANQANDFPQAVRQYCQAMSFMMAELKRQGRSGNGFSKR